MKLDRTALALSSIAFAVLVSTPRPVQAGELKGRLFVGDKPAAGVTLAALPAETAFEAAQREAKRATEPKPLATAVSNSDGTFSLKVPVDPAKPERAFEVQTSGGGTVGITLDGAWDASETEELADVTLVKAATVTGRVLNGEGQPVAGADVVLLPGSGGRGILAGSTTTRTPRRITTREDGTFRFEDAAEQANVLSISKDGFATHQAVNVRSGALAKPIVLVPPAVVTGTVLLPTKKPAAGALVRFEGKATTRWVETNAEGVFRIADAPSGRGTLVADGGDAGSASLAQVTAVNSGAEGKAIALTLTAPGVLEGRVVDAKTQRVLPRVKIETRSDRGERRVVRSGPDGKYKVRSLAPGRLKVTADDPRYVSYVKTQVAINAGETRKLDLPLTLGATVSGRVVDESGAPVAEAKGALGRSRDRDPMAMLRMRFEGGLDSLGKTFRTKSDGSYRLTRLAPGDNQTLALRHPEYEKGQLTGIALEGGQTKTGVNLTLRRGFSIGGVVVDRDGNPIPFADVEIQTDGNVRMGRGGAVAMMSIVGLADRAPVQTGADGRFEARGLAPGSYDVVASKKGWVRAEAVKVAVGEDKGAEPVRITLGPGAVIAGFVRSKNGTPLESVLVNARLAGSGGMGPRGGGGFSEPTGPDGAFYIESLKPGETYEVSLFEPTRIMAGPPAGGRKITAPAENVDLEGTGKGRITGIALDLETGRPIEEFTVTYEADRGPGGQMFRMVTIGGGRRGMGPEKVEVKSPDGAFTLEDVTAGTWRVVVEAKGYQSGRTGGVVVEEGGQRDGVEVKLAAGRVLRGRVTDAKTGRPVPDANVNARLAGGERNPMAMFSEEGELLTTDADGRFEVPGLSPGKYQVTAKHTDYADASEITEVGDKGGNAELRLSTGGVIAGVVLSESRQPLPNVDVNLEPAGQGGGPFSFGGGGNSGTTDSAGRFRFTHLLPGRHSVRATVRSRSSSPVEVVLQEGESKEDVTLQLEAGATVRGLVSGLPTDQLKGVSISASGKDGYYASASTGADGRFELAGAPAGNLNVSATAGDFMTATRRATKSVEIPEGARDAEVEVEFESGFQLTGRIQRSGRGVSGARVFASRQGMAGSAIADSGGDYRLEGLTKGTYSVSVSSAEGNKTESVTLDGDQSLDFELGAAKITGSVVEEGTGRPLADAVVESALVAASETVSGAMMRMTATTDTNGRFTLDNLDAKSYRLTARKAGFQYETKDVTADAGGAEVKLELARGEGIGLKARDGIYNVPLRGLFARAFDAANNAVYSGSIPLDSEGRGEVPSLKPGRYTLVLDPDGYAPVTLEGVSAPSSETPVTFTPGGSVEIRSGAETQGKALAGAKARLLRGGQPYRWSPFSVNGEIGLQAAQRRIDNVAPGAYTLQIDGGASKSFNVTEGGTVVVDMP